MGDLFVNLARRNQSLVQRQLELLDDLERNEHDPAALDALFKLDHMATRMRRNAESLLVLSGAEQPRQWQQPIALIDVVRAAAAEIADFPRVELVGIDDDLAVSGRAVSDVAHLLAELLENATSFSPPDTAVVVSGAVSATGFVLAVSDQGIGMAPDRIAEANTLLAHPPVVGLALSRALGLHVVGSLAQRHAHRGGAAARRARWPRRPGGAAHRGARAAAGLRAVGAGDRQPDLLARSSTTAARPSPSAPDVSCRVRPTSRRSRSGVGKVSPRAVPRRPSRSSRPHRRTTRPTYDTPTYEARVRRPHVDVPPTRRSTTAPTYDVPPSTLRRTTRPRTTHPRTTRPRTTRPHRTAARRHLRRNPIPTRPGSRRRAAAHPRSRAAPESPPSDRRADAPDAEVDPMRAYRVHELLTRHAQGKKRGQAGEDPTADTAPVPGAPGGAGGREMMQQLSAEARNLNWLVSNFVERVPGVREATVVSSDGLLIALSDGLDRSSGDRLAAVSAGLLSIAKGGSTPIGGGRVHEVIVEMDNAMLFVMRVSDTSVLAATTARPCDVGLVGYEMAVLVDKCATALTPGLVSELQTALPRSAIR